ncbi:MAG: MaoC family dehydratase [Chloroflexota bacterium]
MDLSTLQPGQRLCGGPLTIPSERAVAYRAAVGASGSPGAVPGMAVAALVMAEAMAAVDLPAGTVHTGQEVAFSGPVAAGEALETEATVAANSVRRGTRFLVLELAASRAGKPVLVARANLAIPEPEAGH